MIFVQPPVRIRMRSTRWSASTNSGMRHWAPRMSRRTRRSTQGIPGSKVPWCVICWDRNAASSRGATDCVTFCASCSSGPRQAGVATAGFFTDARKLIWEYPRETPDGDQMDFVESMEIENGPIRRHFVYWGWFGVKVLEGDRYHR
jgi:hypothetical protein